MSRDRATVAFVGAIVAGVIWMVAWAPRVANALPRSCEYGGRTYYDGAMSCQGGAAYQCDDGTWRALGRSC